MAKKKYKSEEDIIAKDEKSIRMEGVQNLYNFLFEACNILRGPVSQDNFKDYITPILYLNAFQMFMMRKYRRHLTKAEETKSMHHYRNNIDL